MQGWCDSVHQTLFVRRVPGLSRLVWEILHAIQQTTCRKSIIVTDNVWVVIIIVLEETTSARCAPAHPPHPTHPLNTLVFLKCRFK